MKVENQKATNQGSTYLASFWRKNKLIQTKKQTKK
jgi:hypothetical protein